MFHNARIVHAFSNCIITPHVTSIKTTYLSIMLHGISENRVTEVTEVSLTVISLFVIIYTYVTRTMRKYHQRYKKLIKWKYT